MHFSLSKRGIPIVFFIFIVQGSADAEEHKIRSFQEWCEDASISRDARRTVEELLLVAGTKDCVGAQKILKKMKSIGLGGFLFTKDAWEIEPYGPQPKKRKHCDEHMRCDAALSAVRKRNLNDIRPLESFDWLEGLVLDDNLISDVSLIIHFKKMKHFSIYRNPINLKKCPFPIKNKFGCNFD